MKKLYTFLILLGTAFSASAQCTDLFFSEYSEGSSNNKYMEVYNPTSSNVDLSGYSIFQVGNGGSFTNTLQLFGTLEPNGVFIFCADQADASILALADTALGFPSVAHFNGDDAMLLLNGSDTIDQVGATNWVDPGSSWTVGTGSTKDYTLVRKITIQDGDTNWATTAVGGWDVYAQNTWSFAGSHSSDCHPPLTPEVSFSMGTAWVDEDAGTYNVMAQIASPSATDTTWVDVSITGGTAVSGTDYTATTPVTLEFPAGSSAEQMLTITLIDNADMAADKTIELEMSNLSSNAVFGDDSTMTINVVNDDYQTTTIADMVMLNSDLAPSNEGLKYEITGTVYGIDLDGNAGLSFTIIDGTDGMNIFNFVDVSDYVVTEGDEITVQGEVDFYNGLYELKADSIKLNSAGNTLKTPVKIYAPNEETESDFVQLRKVWIADGTTVWPGGNVTVTNQYQDTFQVRIDPDVTDVVGTSVLWDTMTIIGIGGQFDRDAPYDEGYQVFPRGLSDIQEYVYVMGSTDEKATVNVKAYPNPTTGIVNVEGGNWETYDVYTLAGVKVAEGNVVERTIELSGLTDGLYFINLENETESGKVRILLAH